MGVIPPDAGAAGAIDEAYWETRGRAAYTLADDATPPGLVTQRAAEDAVLRRLGTSLRAAPAASRDTAIAAAARGFLAAHQAMGRAIERAAGAVAPAGPSTCPVEILLAARRSDAARGAPRRPSPPRARKLRAAGELSVVTFTLASQAEIARGLTGGTARLLAGEDPIAAVSRRIARETRCVVEGVAVDRREPVVGAHGTLWHCRYTLRSAPRRHAVAPAPVALEVVVRDYRPALAPAGP